MNYYDIDVHMADNDDIYAPPVPKNILQRIDNYQIYSLILCEYRSTSSGIKKTMIPISSSGNYGNYGFYSTNIFYYTTTEGFNNPPPIVGRVEFTSATKMIAFQRFSIEKIPINFDEIARKLNVKPKDVRLYKYVSSSSVIKTTSDTLPNGVPPPIIQAEYVDVAANNNLDLSQYSYVSRDHVTTTPGSFTGNSSYSTNVYKLIQDKYTSVGTVPILLDMYALLTGYIADTRLLADNHPTILPNTTGEMSIKYYRQNPFETVPNVLSIDWYMYKIKLIKGKALRLPIINPVFGTLIIDGDDQLVADVKSQLSITQPNRYKWSDYLAENIDALVDEWKQIHDSYILPSAPPSNLVVFENIETQYLEPLNKILSANNNCWNNDPTNYPDVGIEYGINLPKVLSIANSIPNSREKAYEWHIEPQIDGSFGRLIMNSPQLLEIHAALNAGKWGVNPDDPTKAPVVTLGWLVEKIAWLCGIRPKRNGEIDKDNEKKLVRQVIDNKKNLEPKEIGVTSFGKLGMVVKRINNRFNNKNEIVSDQCVIVQDIPQLMQEYFEQINLALGLQESSAVEIKQGEKGETKARFNSQLEILIELLNLMSNGNEMIRSTLVSSLISQSQSSEIIAGLGLPSVTKTIPIKIDKKVHQIPFKGIAAHRSISQEVATCTYNIGVVLGQVL